VARSTHRVNSEDNYIPISYRLGSRGDYIIISMFIRITGKDTSCEFHHGKVKEHSLSFVLALLVLINFE
jgi:hypothetical protein